MVGRYLHGGLPHSLQRRAILGEPGNRLLRETATSEAWHVLGHEDFQQVISSGRHGARHSRPVPFPWSSTNRGQPQPPAWHARVRSTCCWVTWPQPHGSSTVVLIVALSERPVSSASHTRSRSQFRSRQSRYS